mgnify:CR=1 FL=1
MLLAVAGCGLFTIAAARVAEHGLTGLTAGQGDLRPALGVVGLLIVTTALALRSLRDQARATRRLTAQVRAITAPSPPALDEAVASTRLTGRVDLVRADEPFSFAYGLWRPRVAVSSGLLEGAGPEELLAVLVHERYHVRHHDPAKVVAARAASDAYFFLPALHGLRRRYATASELAADRRAIAAHGRGALAGALFRTVRGPAWDELTTAAAIGGPELLDVRVQQLESGADGPAPPVSRRQVVLTAAALAVIAITLVFTVVSLGGPAAMMREAMGRDTPGDDMDMGLAGWWWVPVLAVAVAIRWRRRGRPVDTTVA